MAGYTKLFGRIIHSTIWREDDKTRILWITMLALADQDGIVQCTIPGLADAAKISLDDCERALDRFQKPDKYSWSQEEEGRRIKVVDGGWFLINHAKYRQLLSLEDRREKTRIRVQKFREANKKSLQSVTPVTSNAGNDKHKQEAEAEAIKPHTQESVTEEQVIRISKLHPNLSRKKQLSRIEEEVICEAIIRDGYDLVFSGTKNLSDAVAKWPAAEKRFIPNGERFFREAQYTRDPDYWNRTGGKQRESPLAVLERLERQEQEAASKRTHESS